MSTFYDPAKVRALAEAGDPFWKGAAWVLDQQAAARIDTTDYDREWTRNVVALNPHSEEFRRLRRVLADVTDVDALMNRDLNA